MTQDAIKAKLLECEQAILDQDFSAFPTLNVDKYRCAYLDAISAMANKLGISLD